MNRRDFCITKKRRKKKEERGGASESTGDRFKTSKTVPE